MDQDTSPQLKVDDRFRWKLWHLYNELDNCRPERVQALRTAIAYLGGSLDFRYPLPAAIAREGVEDIPVRQLDSAVAAPVEPEVEIILPLPVAPVWQQMSLV